MKDWLRRGLSVFVAVTILGGTIGAEFAFAGEPCDHVAPADSPGHDKHHHDSGADSACFACPCCAVVPTLPDAPLALRAPRQVAFVIYAETSPRLAGRSLAPDPSPPRPIA